MLHRDIVVLHLFGEAFSGGEDLIHIGGDIDLVRFPTGPGDSRHRSNFSGEVIAEGSEIHTHFLQQLAGEALVLPGKGAQQMELFDLHIGVLGRQALGSRDRLQRFLCKFLCIHTALLLFGMTVPKQADLRGNRMEFQLF